MPDRKLHTEHGDYVSRDILLAYLRGNLDPAKKERVERLMERDDFLREAVEGLRGMDVAEAEKALDSLYTQIDIITGARRVHRIAPQIRNLAVAAMALVFISLTWLVVHTMRDRQAQQIALNGGMEVSDSVRINSDMGSGNYDSLHAASQSITGDEDQIAATRRDTSQVDIQTEIAEEQNPETLHDNAAAGHTELHSVPQPPAQKAVTENASVATEEKPVTAERVEADKANGDTTYSESFTGGAGVYNLVDKMPVFPGGRQAMYKYIYAHLRDLGWDTVGNPVTVQVQFTVNAEGSVNDIKVLNRDTEDPLTKSLIKVFGSMPAWTPGVNGGQEVPVKMMIPVTIGTGSK